MNNFLIFVTTNRLRNADLINTQKETTSLSWMVTIIYKKTRKQTKFQNKL